MQTPVALMIFNRPDVTAHDEQADDFFAQQVIAQEVPQPEQLSRRLYKKLHRADSSVTPETVRLRRRRLRRAGR